MRTGLGCLLLLLAGLTGGCATLSQSERDRASIVAATARSDQRDCDQADNCARPSSLLALSERALRESLPRAPRHYALILDYGQDALVSRLDLFRAAKASIDLQTYVLDEDDAGRLILEELLAAAKRGVRVRLLVDQLSALKKVNTLAALSGLHQNIQMRVYNPVLGNARISYPQYALAAACCWRRLNQRMHSKMLVIDQQVAITGGRNYQDDYFDWSDEYNFRDRDVLIAGPEVQAMQSNFDAFWNSRLAVPIERLSDVGWHLLRHGVPPFGTPQYQRPARVAAVLREVDDTTLIEQRLARAALAVRDVDFLADLPEKHRPSRTGAAASSSYGLRELIESARVQVLLQTPYLVLSKPAQRLFRALHEAPGGPDVIISTNSLAATDSFITYALSYKYKHRYLHELGFQIYEFKPFPEDAPIDVDATGAIDIAWLPDGTPVIDGEPVHPLHSGQIGRDGLAGGDVGAGASTPRGSGHDDVADGDAQHDDAEPRPLTREYSALRFAGINVNARVPLKRAGVRVGLHAKSLVIDERIGVIGTHNFDPRGEDYNTESAVAIADPVFARTLAASIRRDMTPENAWVIARRDKLPLFSGVGYSLAKATEYLPIFDLWPIRYATSYEFRAGPNCPMPLPPDHPRFRQCYEPVGDFPEVATGFRSVMTRIFTAFGAGLAPIL